MAKREIGPFLCEIEVYAVSEPVPAVIIDQCDILVDDFQGLYIASGLQNSVPHRVVIGDPLLFVKLQLYGADDPEDVSGFML